MIAGRSRPPFERFAEGLRRFILYGRVLERGARQRYEWAVVLEASGNFVMFRVRVIRAIERIAHGERDLSLSVERMGIATHDFQILIETRSNILCYYW